VPLNKNKKQFLQFCLVGVSGTLVDFVTLNLLLSHGAPLLLAGSFSFGLAVANNFVWNSSWTFQSSTKKNKKIQVLQFSLISLVGLCIRVPILYAASLVPPNLLRIPLPSLPPEACERLLHNFAAAFAIGVVLIWNYIGNKYWTFQDSSKKNMEEP